MKRQPPQDGMFRVCLTVISERLSMVKIEAIVDDKCRQEIIESIERSSGRRAHLDRQSN